MKYNIDKSAIGFSIAAIGMIICIIIGFIYSIVSHY